MKYFPGSPVHVKQTRILFVALISLTTLVNLPVRAATEKVKIVWLAGLSDSANDYQVSAEKQVADEFNASHPDIELDVEVLDKCQDGPDCLVKFIASGEAADIVGPTSLETPNSIKDLVPLLDLTPYFSKYHYDLSTFEPGLPELYRTPDAGYISIPFGVYPTVVYYNRDLFDKAGLNYPPASFGQQYKMPDGTNVDWNYDTLAKIATRLTLDRQGNDATSTAFDAENIVQYGLNFQWVPMPMILSDIQPETFYDSATHTITIGPQWRKAAKWLQDGLWKYHFIPGTKAEFSDNFQPTAFGSGHLAMALAPLWFTCCLSERTTHIKPDWDMAVAPKSPDGQYHNSVDADSFYILKSTQHPDAAFTALSYLVNEAEAKLTFFSGDYPARQKYREQWVNNRSSAYPQGVNWSVATESLKYTDPGPLSYQAYVPQFQEVSDQWSYFGQVLFSDSGATINTDTELDNLQRNLQSIVNGE